MTIFIKGILRWNQYIKYICDKVYNVTLEYEELDEHDKIFRYYVILRQIISDLPFFYTLSHTFLPF